MRSYAVHNAAGIRSQENAQFRNDKDLSDRPSTLPVDDQAQSVAPRHHLFLHRIAVLIDDVQHRLIIHGYGDIGDWSGCDGESDLRFLEIQILQSLL